MSHLTLRIQRTAEKVISQFSYLRKSSTGHKANNIYLNHSLGVCVLYFNSVTSVE